MIPQVSSVVLIAAGVILGLLLPFLLFTPRAPRPATNLRGIDALDAWLESLTAHRTPPALDVVVLRDGQEVYRRSFGVADCEGERPASADGLYHYWSVTKLFTATAVMQLVEEGRLRLDDAVTDHLPGFATVDRSGKPAAITVRQLLDHTSGMRNLSPFHLVGWIHGADDAPVAQSALLAGRMASYRRLSRRPGARAAYSNAGYIVLGALVESVAGQSYESFVRERVLAPLALNDTGFVYGPGRIARAVTGTHPLFHFFTPLLLLVHHDWFTRWVSRTRRQRMWLVPLHSDYTAPTGLIGTARDLARFGQAFLAGGELEGRRILAAGSVRDLLDGGYAGASGPDRERMGLGWHWWSDAALPFKGHGGEGPGFAAQLALFPERNMVIAILASDTLIDRVGITQAIAATFA